MEAGFGWIILAVPVFLIAMSKQDLAFI
jgi:hypothetical protein